MKPCIACPFNDGFTDAATQAQNYGCLPTAREMLEHFDRNGVSISCHNKADRKCRGLLSERPVAIDAPVRDYADWCQNG